jgi:hypothetical protein
MAARVCLPGGLADEHLVAQAAERIPRHTAEEVFRISALS